MATVNGLIQRARLEIGDAGRLFQSLPVVGDGVINTVTLPEKPVDALALTVTQTSALGVATVLVPGDDYTVDEHQGVILLANPIPEDGKVVVTGTAFRYFTTEDWSTFVNTAFLQHNHGRSNNLARLDPVEDYLVVLLALCEALFALMNDSAFDIDIQTPEGISIPRHQRFDQLMQMLMARQDQYQRLASALNVGLNRIEMFTLRRVSRATGRLVPIYIDQEIDEATPARRVYVPIDQQGAKVIDDGVLQQDLTVEVGIPIDITVNTGFALSPGDTLRAQLRRNALGGPLIYFTTTVVDGPTGVVQVTMADTGRTRLYFNGDAFWDLRVVSNGITRTLCKGNVYVIERPFL